MTPRATRVAVLALATAALAGGAMAWVATRDAEPMPSTAGDLLQMPGDEFAGPPDELGELGLPVNVELRRRAVVEELAGPASAAWAGEYFHGDGEGMNVTLLLAPRAGAATWWNGCLGQYGAEGGAVVEGSNGLLQMGFPPRSADESVHFPTLLRPVTWGERRYLLEPTELVPFVNAMNAGWEPRDLRRGRFLLATGDEAKPVQGLPDLPPEVLALVRSTSLRTKVLSVERQPSPTTFLGNRTAISANNATD